MEEDCVRHGSGRSSTSDISVNLDRLRFDTGRLYGRETEEKCLRDLYRRVVQNGDRNDDDHGRNEMALILGQSGTGKTALAQTLRGLTEKRKDYFVSGKFNLMKRSIPYAAIVDALAELPKEMTNAGETSSPLREKMGEDLSKIIVRCVPALNDILCVTVDKRERHSSLAARKQFIFAFQSFFRNVCEGRKKLVLFIDDLQWADAASLELLEILATDKENKNLFIVGAYRDNEVDETDPLIARLREIERSKEVNINRLHVTDLDQKVVNEMVADELNTSVDSTKQLAETVHAKTHGNVFFVIEFMKSLVEDELLKFNFGTFFWSWDLGEIEAKYVTSNVADLMLRRLRKVPDQYVQVLSISSCLGSSFDVPILVLIVEYLQEILSGNYPGFHCILEKSLSFIKLAPCNVKFCIDEDVSLGLLEAASKIGDDSYRFPHDEIRQAAFGLIPEKSKGLLQWSIGQALVNKLTSDQLSQVLFGAVDLLNNGMDDYCAPHSLHQNAAKRAEMKEVLLHLANLNLGAGKKAMGISAFRQASMYLRASIKYIGGGSEGTDMAFVKHPAFCLDAHQALAESLSCCGEFEEMQKILGYIFKYTAVKEGRMNAYSTLVDAHGARDQFVEAFDAGFRALAEFGDQITRNPGKVTILVELLSTKKFMKKYPVDTLRDLPRLTDTSRAIMLKILVRLVIHAQVERPMLLPLLVFRIMKWTCLYGVCNSSPPGFAAYGFLLIRLGDLKAGYDYARIAMELLEQSGNKSEYCFTSMVVCIVLSGRRQNLK